MNKIYQVLSNLKFGDTIHKAGSIIEAKAEEYGYLVKDKVLREIEGAESVAHGVEIIAQEAEDKGVQEAEKAVAPANTWGPQPDKASEAPQEQAKTEETIVPPVPDEALNTQTGAPAVPTPPASAPVTGAPNLDAGLNL